MYTECPGIEKELIYESHNTSWDMLRSCVIDYEGSWDRHIPLV